MVIDSRRLTVAPIPQDVGKLQIEQSEWAFLLFSNIIRILGDIPVSQLTPASLEKYKSARLKEKVKPVTVNIEIGF